MLKLKKYNLHIAKTSSKTAMQNNIVYAILITTLYYQPIVTAGKLPLRQHNPSSVLPDGQPVQNYSEEYKAAIYKKLDDDYKKATTEAQRAM
jgi:hypothetical protein